MMEEEFSDWWCNECRFPDGRPRFVQAFYDACRESFMAGAKIERERLLSTLEKAEGTNCVRIKA